MGAQQVDPAEMARLNREQHGRNIEIGAQVEPDTEGGEELLDEAPLTPFPVIVSKKSVQDVEDFEVFPLDVPEWKQRIHIRRVKGVEGDEFQQRWLDKTRQGKSFKVKELKVEMIILGACDPDGVPLFGIEDAAWLNRKTAPALNRISMAVRSINALDELDREELRENLSGGRTGNSGSN